MMNKNNGFFFGYLVFVSLVFLIIGILLPELLDRSIILSDIFWKGVPKNPVVLILASIGRYSWVLSVVVFLIGCFAFPKKNGEEFAGKIFLHFSLTLLILYIVLMGYGVGFCWARTFKSF